jgi:hypothetical protein
MKKLLFVILFLLPLFSHSQSTLKYQVGTYGMASPNAEIMPHWLIYNQNGLFKGHANELLTYIGAELEHSFGVHWKIDMGIKGINKLPISDSYLQESYLNLSYGKLKLIMGTEEMTFSDYNEQIGSGSFYLSRNARPFPRIGMGFYEFTDVPFTDGYVQVKGFLNQGILNDDRGLRGSNKPLFHEKSVYIRSNKFKINPHFGITHSAMFGGTMPNGTEIPVDYLATIFARSSKKVGEVFWGEETNVAGGHFGMFDVGAKFKVTDLDVQVFLQKPVNDKSGFAETFRRNKDFIYGISVKNKDARFLKGFVYERIYTIWQCGPGIPDPYINGNNIFDMDLSDLDKILFENYGIETHGISKDDFWRIVRRKENYGYEYGGRDSYYNNGMYYKGLSYYGNALGSSLLLTKDRVLNINPDFDASYDLFFVNTRLSAHHFGFLGNITKKVDYKLIITYTNNLGTYAGLNRGHNNWDSMNPDSDYKYFFETADYFVDGKNQVYTMIQTGYALDKIPGLKLDLNIGVDGGRLYNNHGVLLGLRYSGSWTKGEGRGQMARGLDKD